MEYSKALNILLKKNILQKPQVSELSISNNYHTFLIVDGKNKYVLRLVNKRASADNRLKKSFLILKFIEQERISFSEKVLFFDSKNSFMLSTFISGKELSVRDLKGKRLLEFVDKIIFLRKLKLGRFVSLCRKEKKKIDNFENPLNRLVKLKKGRIKYIEENKNILSRFDIDVSELSSWIKREFSFFQENYKKKKYKKNDIFFEHGDVAGANIILGKEGLQFIDWDNARFTNDLSFSMADLFFHSYIFSRSFINNFLTLYIKKAKIKVDKKDLWSELGISFKFITFSGTLWALEAFVRSQKNKTGEGLKYLDIYRERLSLYNNFSLEK